MGNNYHIYAAREIDLAASVGIAITKWAMLENCLLRATSFALRQDATLTIRLLGTFRTFALLLDFTDVSMRDRLDDHPSLVFWTSLVEYVRELSGDRNFMAHTGIVRHTDGPGDSTTDWATAIPMLGPTLNSMLEPEDKRRTMGVNEVRELILDFEQAYKAIHALTEALSRPEPLPGIYGVPIVRRRPKRNERLEADRRARRAQQKSSPS